MDMSGYKQPEKKVNWKVEHEDKEWDWAQVWVEADVEEGLKWIKGVTAVVVIAPNESFVVYFNHLYDYSEVVKAIEEYLKRVVG